MVSADRHIPAQSADLHRHVWNKKGYSSKARGLKGRTLGIIGVGQIGRLVAERALAFDMYILYHDIVPCAALDKNEQVKKVSLEEVLTNADFVSLHVPANESTRHLINDQTLVLMQKDAILINSTRGSVVDEAGPRRRAEATGEIAGAAMDVYENEPAAGDKTISERAARSTELPSERTTSARRPSRRRRASRPRSCTSSTSTQRTGRPPHCVNLAVTSPATCLLTVRYRNETGVLWRTSSTSSSDTGLHTEEMSSIIFNGAIAACARIQLDSRPTGGQLEPHLAE